jgi:GrpB-like predicted nucleotidyltransferase (UPF0157 family)
MTIGLKRGTVQLVAHTGRWAKSFGQERKNILSRLEGTVTDIEHIGSTAIPGIVAKPIVDMLAGVPRVGGIARRLEYTMRSLGYQLRPNAGSKWNVLFVKGPESRRTHYLHVVRIGGAEWKRSLLFRDYLRSHPARARAYERLKLRLAQQYADRRPLYTKLKSAFIIETLRLATR